MKNRIFSLLIAFMLLLSLTSGSVFAMEVLDPDAPGSITVTVPQSHGQIGGTVILHRVADVSVSGSAYNFTYTRNFAGMEMPLDNLNDSDLVIALAVYAAEHGITGRTERLENNTAVFNAKAGLYLVVHADFAGSKNTFMPFLVCIPTISDGAFDYHVSATPKTGPAPEAPTEPGPTVPPPSGLPQTGQMNWPIPLLASTGLMLFALGWLLRARGRGESCDA